MTDIVQLDNFGREIAPRRGRMVTENTPKIPQPSRIKMQLRDYQLASIYVMDQIERQKCIKREDRDYITQAAVLSNDFGSGKTATLLGLVAHSIYPVNGPEYPVRLNAYSSKSVNDGGRPRGVIFRRFKPACVLPTTVVFAGHNVIDQWDGEIRKFIDGIRLLVIDGIRDLKAFYDTLNTTDPATGKSMIARYEMVLIKNRTISGAWSWKYGETDDDTTKKSAPYIYNMVALMCRRFCFARLIVDDFDTVGLPGIAGNINALFTWFVSCTRKKATINRYPANTVHWKPEQMVHNSVLVYGDITQNGVLYDWFNVRTDPDYIACAKSIGRPQYFLYRVESPNHKIKELIACMAGDQIGKIMEALNGDSVSDAAAAAGITAKSPAEIFRHLLKRKYQELQFGLQMQERFDVEINKMDIASLPKPDDDKDTYGKQDFREGRKIDKRYPGLKGMLDEERTHWNDVVDECHSTINRFRDRLSGSECGYCFGPLNDGTDGRMILPCCSEIIHSACAFDCCGFDRIQGADDKSAVMGTCPFEIGDDPVMFNLSEACCIDKDFNPTDLDLTSAKASVRAEGPAADPEVVPAPSRVHTKYSVLIDIVDGLLNERGVDFACRIPGMTIGNDELGSPAYGPIADALHEHLHVRVASAVLSWFPSPLSPRILIFANFENTLVQTEEALATAGIVFARLGGTSKKINATVADFNADRIQVMTINSVVNCSSLNLQHATDLVYMHHIMNGSIRGQVAGRIQRLGRATDAQLHFICYDEEVRDTVMAVGVPGGNMHIDTTTCVDEDE